MNISAKLAVIAALLVAGSIGLSHAQVPKAKAPQQQPAAPAPAAPKADAAPANPPAAPPPEWAVRCSSLSRSAALECAMEQSAVLTRTGQLIVLVNIRVTSDTRMPISLIQLPLGLNVPGGIKVQVDDGKAVDMAIQTCEARGCYAGGPVAPELLAALRTGKELKVTFQNLAKEPITIPIQLTDFATAYDKIK